MTEQTSKKELIEKFQKHGTDSGSSEIQVAIYTDHIKKIANHLSTNKKDFSALRGLQKLVSRRKKLLAYLFKQDPSRYTSLIQELGIRGSF